MSHRWTVSAQIPLLAHVSAPAFVDTPRNLPTGVLVAALPPESAEANPALVPRPNYAGNSSRALKPPPLRAARTTSPPCSRAIERATESPSPTPPVSGLRELSTR